MKILKKAMLALVSVMMFYCGSVGAAVGESWLKPPPGAPASVASKVTVKDLVKATATPMVTGGCDNCFGAIGNRCNSYPFCYYAGGIQYNCSVSIGSQLHDSCCSLYPNGYNCGGNGSQNACVVQWNLAVNDTIANRSWWVAMDYRKCAPPGTSIAYLQASLWNNSWQWAGQRQVGSYQAPRGAAIWPWHWAANHTWCWSGSAWYNGWDIICN